MTVICLLFVCLFFKQPVYASVFENMVADRVEIETVISKTGVISVRQTLTGELTGSTTRLSFTLQQPEHGSLELIELAYAQSSDKDNNHFGQLTAIVPFTGEAQRRPHLTYQTMRDDNHLIVEATGDFKAKLSTVLFCDTSLRMPSCAQRQMLGSITSLHFHIRPFV